MSARPTETAIASAASAPRAGTLEMLIPKLRQGSDFPSFLEAAHPQ